MADDKPEDAGLAPGPGRAKRTPPTIDLEATEVSTQPQQAANEPEPAKTEATETETTKAEPAESAEAETPKAESTGPEAEPAPGAAQRPTEGVW